MASSRLEYGYVTPLYAISLRSVSDSENIRNFHKFAHFYCSGDYNATINEGCEFELIDGIWDPTHSCISNSASSYCTAGRRCNETDVDYATLCSTDLFSCAVGDISSRVGIIDIAAMGIFDGVTNIYTVVVSDDLSAPLYAIPQRSIRLECVDPTAPVFTDIGFFGNDTFQLQDICAVTIQTEGTVVTGPPIIVPGTKSPTTPTPTVMPTFEPTLEPTTDPTYEPTMEPTEDPTFEPTTEPTYEPTYEPTWDPSKAPTTYSPTEDDQGEDNDDQGEDEATAGLGTGGIVGIAVGVVVLIAIILVLVYCFILKPKKIGNDTKTANKDGIEINQMREMKSASTDDIDGGGDEQEALNTGGD